MIKLKNLLEVESAAASEAHRRGLESAGWGKWKIKGGPVVAKTVNGKLVAIKQKSTQTRQSQKSTQTQPSGKDVRNHFKIPNDFKKNYHKYTGIKYSNEFAVGFGYVSLTKLKAAGTPSEVGEHVKRMQKILKSGKKLPPISVSVTKDGKLEVDDGNTRVLALKRMGMKGKIPAVVATLNKRHLDRLETF